MSNTSQSGRENLSLMEDSFTEHQQLDVVERAVWNASSIGRADQTA